MKTRIIKTDSFVGDAVAIIHDVALESIATRGIFRLGLCGGNTPRPVFAELAKLYLDLPWEKIQVTFGDERCVPPEDAQSNYKMAKTSLFDAVNFPEGNIFRIRGEIDPEAASLEYEQKLAQVAARFEEPRYSHDLLLLGLGEDGHTASLFPGSPALDETERNVIHTIGPKPPPQRITFTLPLINAARHVCFLVNDPAKSAIIERATSGDLSLPSARVKPESGRLTWLIGM
ncbi:MAG TPA: 6-phosphogluconolactonase [Chthoniobacteraceae bacterium]|nr:6-phosphogluconolactonase [Chthoniobacteraceae bacterium]